MGCGSCGTGKPNGCKSNGGCSSGGCNRMNVYNWLNDLPIADIDNQCLVIEISFKQGSRKDYYRNATQQYFDKGDLVTVEGVGGFDVGEVSLSGELVRLQLKKHGIDEFNPDLKKILRKSNERDVESYLASKSREATMLARSREIARDLRLQMKLSEVEIQADGKKATFFYTADDRVDFREMIKQFAAEFKLKVEMRQIGIRQEAAKVGGIGSCGRELCCSTWLHDFKSVNTTAARYQNLSINQTKLSGQCGRLKCCLNFELDTYLDALQHFPNNAEHLEIEKGSAYLIKKDIFKNLMWYTIQGGSKHYPLSISRVKEIKRLNQQGVKPADLEPVEVTDGKPKEIEPQFVDVVGQLSLRSLEKSDRRRKEEARDRNNKQQGGNHQNKPNINQPNNRSSNHPAQQQRRDNQHRPQQQAASSKNPQQQQQEARRNAPPQNKQAVTPPVANPQPTNSSEGAKPQQQQRNHQQPHRPGGGRPNHKHRNHPPRNNNQPPRNNEEKKE